MGIYHAVVACAFLTCDFVVSLASADEHHAPEDPCRVAVSLSGNPRSFRDPVVHRSFRHYVVEAIVRIGCQVDVLAYAMLEDDLDLLMEDEDTNPGFAQEVAEIESAIGFVSPNPTQLVWHQDQAGLIPNSCPGSAHYYQERSLSYYRDRDANPSDADGGNDSGDGVRHRDEISKEEQEWAYWRLYGSLAAYQMATQKETEQNGGREKGGDFSYDWIVATNFDVVWTRPLPPLSSFSREAVWLGTNAWPVSDDFALVPRIFADQYFSAVSAYHSCEDGTWPPQGSWWQPSCSGGGSGSGSGFLESVIFRHLHAKDVPYRPYSLFDYYVVHSANESGRGNAGTDGGDGRKRSAGDGYHIGSPAATAEGYRTACILLEAAGLLTTGVSSRDCHDVLSEYADLRYRTLRRRHHDGVVKTRNSQRFAAGPFLPADDPTAWEALVGAPARAASAFASQEEREEEDTWGGSEGGMNIRKDGTQKKVALDDALRLELVRSKLISLRDAVAIGTQAEYGLEGDSQNAPTGGRRSQEQRRDLSEHEEPELKTMRHSWTMHSQEGCRIDQFPGLAPHIIRSYSTELSLLHELALAVKCLAHRLVEGVGSASDTDGSNTATTCAGSRPLELAMMDVAFHSEELGVCTADGSSGLTAIEHVRRFFADPSAHCVGYGKRLTKGAPGFATAAAVAAAAPAASAAAEPSNTALKGRMDDGYVDPAAPEGTLGALTDGQDSEPEPATSVESDAALSGEAALDTSTSSACPALLVKELIVLHPTEGAVYWEGPVNVSLSATLTGPGLESLNLQHVHACADIEESWPMRDLSRFCVSLEDLASPESQPSLVFGSILGVVEGSVSLRDARPGCFPPGSPRGGVLPMADDLGGNPQRLASKPVHFKIIHHESTLQRRGRPLGPAPIGRGFSTIQEFIQDLEREALEEIGVAFEEMQSHMNHSRGTDVLLKRFACASRLDMDARGTALVTTGHQLQLSADQLEWMISEGKLPSEMTYAVDSMRELQLHFPDNSTEAFFSNPGLLGHAWRSVGSFFQKSLLLPMPAPDMVVSTAPLHTWEYDEIPWMEALNPAVDWHAVEEAYLGNQPVSITHVDNFFSEKALALLLDLTRGSSVFVENRANYAGAYPSDGLSHPLLYQIAEEAAERLPRILGRGTPGWPLVQTWSYIYGGNNGEKCTHGIKVHADDAMVNLNVWLNPDSANLGSARTGDGGGLTVFHAKPPEGWTFSGFNGDTSRITDFLRENDHVGNTSVANRQNRALFFDSMLFHQSDPFRFKKGFENRRLNLTFLFGRRQTPKAAGKERDGDRSEFVREPSLPELREVPRGQGGQLAFCL